MAGAEAPGLGRLAANLREAGAAVTDLTETNQAVADQILARARPLMPHRTGALVASMRAIGTPTEATITVGVRYARPALFGAPRAGQPQGARVTPVDVVIQTEAAWLPTYTDHATTVAKTIKGD